jgi:hypothetical protein
VLVGESICTGTIPPSQAIFFFLAHDADGIANVHSLMLNEDATPVALTSASIDIYYYDIAPDASFLVVAERGARAGPAILCASLLMARLPRSSLVVMLMWIVVVL